MQRGRILLLVLVMLATVVCGPRGPDPAGGAPEPRPACPGCPELRVRLKNRACAVAGQVYRKEHALPPQQPGRVLIADGC